MALGGKREGAGRKKGYAAIQAEKSRAFFVKKLEKDLPTIYATLINSAKKGNTKAIEIILERAYGKASQAVTLSDDNGDPVSFNIVLDETNLERIAGRVSHGKNTIKA